MLENMIWQVADHRLLDNVDDRWIRISSSSSLKEALAWGLKTIYGDSRNDDIAPSMIRDYSDGDTILIAMVDTPFIVEFWDTNEDANFILSWTGYEWVFNKVDDVLGGTGGVEPTGLYVELKAKDISPCIAEVCASVCLDHIEAYDSRNKFYHITLLNRENLPATFSNGAYFYRSVDDSKCQFTADQATLPDKNELDFIHFIDDINPKNGFLHFLYDDDLPIEIVLNNMIGNKSVPIKLIHSSSTDIVDIKELVRDYIYNNDDLSTKVIIVESGTEEKRYNLFFNMAAYYPDIAPYLTPDF